MQLKKKINYGAISEIASIYNDRHLKAGRTVSISYVWLLVQGKRETNTETANEIIQIAKTLTRMKQQLRHQLIDARCHS